MLSPLSSTRQAHDDTLIPHAEGWAFRKLARMYGFPQTPGFPEEGWRGGLNAAALGPRGTFRNMLEVLERMFSWADYVQPVTLTPGTPSAVLGSGSWLPEHGLRYVRVTGTTIDQLRYSRPVPAGVVPNLNFVSTETPYWDGGDWDASEIGEARVLPFLVQEVNVCEFRVLLDETVFSGPPSYVLADGTVDRLVAYPGQPFGSQILADAGVGGSQVVGPFPLYLPGEDFPGELQRTLDSLAASGVSVVLIPHKFTS